jgi:hypothetical protein
VSKVLPVSTVAAAIAIFRSYTLLGAAILVAVVVVLWVLADDKRTERLVRVIQAIRPQQYAAAPRGPQRKRNGQQPRNCRREQRG